MLDHPGEQVVAFEHDLLAVEVDAAHRDPLGAHDLELEAGHRQAPLFPLDLAAALDDLGVDHHARAVALVQVVGEEPLAHADLRGGQPDAFGEGHRLVHPVTSGTRSAVISSTLRAGCFSTGSPKSRNT